MAETQYQNYSYECCNIIYFSAAHHHSQSFSLTHTHTHLQLPARALESLCVLLVCCYSWLHYTWTYSTTFCWQMSFTQVNWLSEVLQSPFAV